MYTITKQKPIADIMQSLTGLDRIYIIGCGTCATMCHTGGKAEVLEMKKQLEEAGKIVTGWMVIPTACDSLTRDALAEEAPRLKQSDGVLVMACAYGVQQAASASEKVFIPALDTLFFGMEGQPGQFSEVCIQCGDCVLAATGGICPVTTCPKGLLNGPCGGTREGKCEVDPAKDCAWTLIYNRLKRQGRLDQMRQTHKPKDFQAMTRPRRASVV